MIAISSMSITAHNCGFEDAMEELPIYYMMFLLYFRTFECSDEFEWKSLKVKETKGPSILKYIPQENTATKRTHAISLSYLILNILLLFSSILLLSEYQNLLFNFHKIYFSMFSVSVSQREK